MTAARVLLAEDRASLRAALAETLRRAGLTVIEAAEGKSAMATVEKGGYDLAVLDLKMPVHSGLDLLKESRARWPLSPVIMLTAYASVNVAVDAMKTGASDFLSKPVDPDHLLFVVQRCLDESRRERVEVVSSADRTRPLAFRGIVGESPALLEVREAAETIAPQDVTVLLLGETGSGKEVFARAIHGASRRSPDPFVAVNCAAIPGTLLENELFGHEKGAYTGAHETRVGRFEYAHHGTVFLDEIAEMSPDLQAKLLRVVEEKTFTRIGGLHEIAVDIRLICATNKDLESLVAAGAFRQDLYYRINAFPIRLPPLRERPEDILPLAEHFVAHFRRDLARPNLALGPKAALYLQGQAWPGNVRELMNRIERAAILAGPDGVLDDGLLQAPPAGPAFGAGKPLAFDGLRDPEAWLRAEQRWRVARVVALCGGDRRKAAGVLGVSLSRLSQWEEEDPRP